MILLLIIHFLTAVLIISANFWSEVIMGYLPVGLPIWIIPLFSALVLLADILYQWHAVYEGNRLKYQFIYVVTHKFRTPLTSIKWASESLKKDQNVLMTHKEDIQQIDDASDRLVAMVDILIGASKVDTEAGYVFKAVAMRELLDEILLAYSHKIKAKNIHFEIGSTYGLPMISVDVKRLQFVFQILLENALAYTPKEGTIRVSFMQKGKKLIIAVQDSGIGISKKDLSRVFKAFYRSKTATASDTEGLGLGLSIAKKIIERHKGKIWLYSEGQNKGTTAFVELRLA